MKKLAGVIAGILAVMIVLGGVAPAFASAA